MNSMIKMQNTPHSTEGNLCTDRGRWWLNFRQRPDCISFRFTARPAAPPRPSTRAAMWPVGFQNCQGFLRLPRLLSGPRTGPRTFQPASPQGLPKVPSQPSDASCLQCIFAISKRCREDREVLFWRTLGNLSFLRMPSLARLAAPPASFPSYELLGFRLLRCGPPCMWLRVFQEVVFSKFACLHHVAGSGLGQLGGFQPRNDGGTKLPYRLSNLHL